MCQLMTTTGHTEHSYVTSELLDPLSASAEKYCLLIAFPDYYRTPFVAIDNDFPLIQSIQSFNSVKRAELNEGLA